MLKHRSIRIGAGYMRHMSTSPLTLLFWGITGELRLSPHHRGIAQFIARTSISPPHYPKKKLKNKGDSFFVPQFV
jgi:hypothetical protein